MERPVHIETVLEGTATILSFDAPNRSWRRVEIGSMNLIEQLTQALDAGPHFTRPSKAGIPIRWRATDVRVDGARLAGLRLVALECHSDRLRGANPAG